MNAMAWLASTLFLFFSGTEVSAADRQDHAQRAGSGNDELRKVALVIGNAAYVNASPLANATNDAVDVCAALKKIDFDVICKTNIVSKREFKDAIYEFTGKVNEKSVALFYFAGHGVQIDGVNYLVPTKAALKTKSDIDDESVQINYLMSELEPREAALNIFLLDACRNNPFVTAIRGYAPTLGLASQLYAPRNSIIAMSTGPGQLSLDGDGRNGTFTKNILKFIPVQKQTVEDMLKAVSGETRVDAKKLGRKQYPQVTSSYTEKYCLAGCLDKKTAENEEQATRLKERQEELDRLQISIALAKERNKELEAQKNELMLRKKEFDKMKLDFENHKIQQGELHDVEQKKQESLRNQKNIDLIDAGKSDVVQKLSEIEAERNALLAKQKELGKLREELSAQQFYLNERNKKIQSRISEEKKTDKKQQSIIIPAF